MPLESLVFSMNQLSGEIPQPMSTMSFLSYLSFLGGKIPSGAQLQGFDASSYVGNSLCGPPLKQTYTIDSVVIGLKNKKMNYDDHVMSWFYLGMGVGSARSFLGVCGALLFQ